MINVEVRTNFYDDELYCKECKNRINLGEKYIIIVEELCDGTIEKTPVHLDCVQETYEEEDEVPFISPT